MEGHCWCVASSGGDPCWGCSMGEGCRRAGSSLHAHLCHHCHAHCASHPNENEAMMGRIVGRSLQLGWSLLRVSLVYIAQRGAHQLFPVEDASCLESQERGQVSSSSCNMHE